MVVNCSPPSCFIFYISYVKENISKHDLGAPLFQDSDHIEDALLQPFLNTKKKCLQFLWSGFFKTFTHNNSEFIQIIVIVKKGIFQKLIFSVGLSLQKIMVKIQPFPTV